MDHLSQILFKQKCIGGLEKKVGEVKNEFHAELDYIKNEIVGLAKAIKLDGMEMN